MNVTSTLTKDYERNDIFAVPENKANSNPIQTQFKANQTQSNPIKPNFKPNQTQFQSLSIPDFVNLTSNPQPLMPSITALSLDGGAGVESLQEAYDVKVTSVLSDDDVAKSVIQFRTNGSDVLVVYDGGDNSYPDPARPEREGSKAILNAFEIKAIVPEPPDADGNGISDACEQIEECACLGNLNTNDQVDLQDLDALVNMLVAAGPPFIVPVEAGHCGDMAEPSEQVDLQDLDAMVNLLVNAGPPFIVPCE